MLAPSKSSSGQFTLGSIHAHIFCRMASRNLYDELRVLISDVRTSLSDRKSTSLEVACEKISAVIQFCHPLRQTDWNVDNADGMYFYIKAFDTIKLGYTFCKVSSIVVAITLFDLGNTADRLDPRFSLPLWKLASSIIQFYKNELKHAASTEYLLILDRFLELLLSSVTFFYTDCLQQLKSEDNDKVTSKECASLSSNLSVNLKMINLLCRIATFSIREFAVTSAPSTCTALVDWFVWLINTRYAGGLFESGTGVPVLLVPHLEPSLFLCIDVTLNYLTTLPAASKENLSCSWAAVCFRHADIDPVVKLRIYGGILVNLARHPHCYLRWLCDDFNIYADTITTCMRLDVTISGQGMRTSGECVRSDISCFSLDPLNRMSRYGTGNLCWQYVTSFATAIELAVVSLASTAERSSLLFHLDKLGGLLARFLVFLTPKQQLQFLEKFPLNRLTFDGSSEPKTGPRIAFRWRSDTNMDFEACFCNRQTVWQFPFQSSLSPLHQSHTFVFTKPSGYTSQTCMRTLFAFGPVDRDLFSRCFRSK
ncbi:hypothetical protein EG68_04209 [Paragonimus skrjabini miyazakii]|uniref:Uncharacterized protein n=1 Tax=Paragonimus skrjabini miyazakii TaxID=59628 RepID=A0A8S9YW44_9TREM|nr:hypothetical protein EG68_04209 [Paragonimus skrjabini miyazakii]